MSTRVRMLALAALALAGGAATCTPSGAADTVSFVFFNETGFDVDAIIDGNRVGTVPAQGRGTTHTDLCTTAVDTFVVSGALLTAGGSIPSPFTVTFTKGDNFVCGDTIRVTYFLDANGNLDQNGFAAP